MSNLDVANLTPFQLRFLTFKLVINSTTIYRRHLDGQRGVATLVGEV